MQKRLIFLGLVLILTGGVSARSAGAADESIVGKWQVKAEAPNGTLDLIFEFKQDGIKLGGTATAMQGSGTFTVVKFENPALTADLAIGDESFRLTATLKDGKLSGAWEKIGTDEKGTWSGTRSPEAAATASNASGISGVWESVAVSPNGDMTANLELRQDGDKVAGDIRSDMGSLPIQAGSFKDNKLQFDLEFGGGTYRIQATLKDNKFTGGWAPAAGGDGGAWSATRKSAAPAPTRVAASPAIIGTWNAVANAPEGDMQFQMEIKQTGDGFSGSFITPDGNLPLPKLTYEKEKLAFEVEYMGGTYRIELILANDKLAGKWSAVAGSETGTFTAERRKS